MSVNFDKIQLASSVSSLKVWLEGSGVLAVPNLPGAGEVQATATIPHSYSSDLLLFQVADTTDGVVLPWQSNDGRVVTYARLDTTNLYITVNHNDSSGFGFPGGNVAYSYRLLIP